MLKTSTPSYIARLDISIFLAPLNGKEDRIVLLCSYFSTFIHFLLKRAQDSQMNSYLGKKCSRELKFKKKFF